MKKSVLLVLGSMVCSLAPAGEATLSSDGIFASTDANIFGSDRRRGATRTTVYEKGVTFDTSAGTLTFGDGARVDALERYFFWKFAEDTSYTRMGGWWDRKGKNEIDLVCEDAIKGRLDFYEVKRDARRIDLAALKAKTEAFYAKNPDMRNLVGDCKGLSLVDM